MATISDEELAKVQPTDDAEKAGPPEAFSFSKQCGPLIVGMTGMAGTFAALALPPVGPLVVAGLAQSAAVS